MSANTKLLVRPIAVCIALFVAFLIYYVHAAVTQPTLFNLDNQYNYEATRYLAKHHRLPIVTADNPDIRFTSNGTTRLLRPPFTFIVSAVAERATAGFVDDETTRQRLGAPLIGAVTIAVVFVGFCLAFNHIGLALLGSTAIGLMPKFVFLASCNNDDIGAILSVSLLFTVVLALLKYGAKTWVLLMLAVGFGLVLQTKYSAWLTLPWFGIFTLIILKPVWPRVARMLPLLIVIVVVAGAWWMMFNMAHYGLGDPSALRHAASVQGAISELEANRQGYSSTGVGLSDLLVNHDQFLSKSYKSFIGYLEWLDLDVGLASYIFYGVVFLTGMLAVVFRTRTPVSQTMYLDILLVGVVLSQCLFYLHHNWLRDIQPQARYVLPVIMPLVYLFLRVLDTVSASALRVIVGGREFQFQIILVAVSLPVVVLLHFYTFAVYITPAYSAKPFYTDINQPRVVHLKKDIKVVATDSLSYEFVGESLEIQRTDVRTPTVTLGSEFCALLPTNALLEINVSSFSKGGFHLRIDRENRGTYNDIYWHDFPIGKSVAILAINAHNCSGVRITLPRDTHYLSLDGLQISELKIHAHGRPI